MESSLRDRLNGAPPLTGDEVLDAYGRRGSTQEIMAPNNDVIRTSAERMISDATSALVAAEGILEMLRVETETFTSEVRHHSNNLAARMATYIQCCQEAASAMQEHRESVLKVAATIAEEPSTIINEPRE
jgi:DNA-binding ferritin-like protein